MEEFFSPPLKDGQLPQKAGRPWTAAELRLKSFDDLHKLWFVCLKERNMLLTERLYYRQVAQSAPDPSRLTKVRRTMATIKVVIGERARATALLAAAQQRDAKLANVKQALEGVFSEGAAAGGAGAGAGAAPSPQELELRAIDAAEQAVKLPVPKAAKAGGKPELSAAEAEKLAAAEAKKRELAGTYVTFKKWGRKYTVPAHLAPEKPTRAEKKRAARSAKYFARARKANDAAPTLPGPSPAYLYATTGKTRADLKAAHRAAAAPPAAAAATATAKQ